MSSLPAQRPHYPRLASAPWHITASPDLGELGRPGEHQVVDHAIFQSRDGAWHLWACVRGARVGRVLYAWESDSLLRTRWEPRGIVMRAEERYGESMNDWQGEEWIQAPHLIHAQGRYWVFYGGHNTELGQCQICLCTSLDGRRFTRYRNSQGYSRVFTGPGEARDPMVIEIDGLYHCYYCGHDAGARQPCKVYVRTSSDLYHWSDHRAVSWGGHASGAGPWSAECPFVVEREGLYYLFRTSEYAPIARTHVYCSDDPYDFGLGNDGKWITTLRVAAPEIVRDGDDWYISSVEDLIGGVQLARLEWR